MSKELKRSIIGLIEVEFKLINKTGLLIRSPLAKSTIGGADTQPMFIMKDYGDEIGVVEVPYIPGSSLKGRMRSLLELFENAELYEISSKPSIHIHVRDLAKDTCKDLDHALDNLFGSPSIELSKLREKGKTELEKQVLEKLAPTRIIVEDIYPSTDYIEKLREAGKVISKEVFLEEKSENTIDRITSAANPRFILRIKPDVEFSGRIKILLFDVDWPDKIGEYIDLLLTGMKLIEDTYLGGSGSRGYGKVEFKDIRILLKTPDYYHGREDPIDITEKIGLIKKEDKDKKEIKVEDLLRVKDKIIEAIKEHIKKYAEQK